MTGSHFDRETVSFGASTLGITNGPSVGLSLLQHPDSSRVGQVARLFPSGHTGTRQLNRQEPAFVAPGTLDARPLEYPAVSRNPIAITLNEQGGIAIRAETAGAKASAAGAPLSGRRDFSAEELEAGIVIELAGVVLLLLHRVADGAPDAEPRHGLLGESLDFPL